MVGFGGCSAGSNRCCLRARNGYVARLARLRPAAVWPVQDASRLRESEVQDPRNRRVSNSSPLFVGSCGLLRQQALTANDPDARSCFEGRRACLRDAARCTLWCTRPLWVQSNDWASRSLQRSTTTGICCGCSGWSCEQQCPICTREAGWLANEVCWPG